MMSQALEKGREKGNRNRGRDAMREGGRGRGWWWLCAFRARPIFPSPFPFLAPATQAKIDSNCLAVHSLQHEHGH